jgi:hypothetical protein
MLISVASEFSKKFRSIGANINDISSKVSTLTKTIPSTDGIGDNSVGTDALSSGSVDNASIASQSITADKLDVSSISSPGSNQRIPAPLNSIEYWSPVLIENSALHTEPYFKDIKIRNVSVDTNGLTFSPERATPLAITNAGLENGVVTLTTNVAHSYEAGDTITISNLPSPFTGVWTISEVPSTTTICYQLSKFNETPVNYKIGEEVAGTVSIGGEIKKVASRSCINGVASLSLQNMFNFESTASQDDNTFDGHGYSVGYIIEVTGLGSPYDGSHIITDVPADQPSILRYNITDRQIETFSTAIPLTSALGDGSSITYTYSNDGAKTTTATGSLGAFTLTVASATGIILGMTAIATGITEGSIVTAISGTTITIDQAITTALSTTAITFSGLATTLDFYTNEPVTITGFTDTGYNKTGAIDIVGSNLFTVLGTYDTLNTPATAGSPQVIVAHVKVDAEARLFLTGKTKVPDSRSISVSWVTDNNPINMYFVCWLTNQTGTNTEPRLIPIDETLDVSISKLQGVNNYYWEIPVDVEKYALLAEVLPGKNPVLLKEAYVFEAIGDQDQKTEHISRVSITNNVATIYTATTHPYATGDVVQMFGLESANSALVGTPYVVDLVSADSTAFTVNTVNLSNTSDYVAVSGTVIGGVNKSTVTVTTEGIAVNSAVGGGDGQISILPEKDQSLSITGTQYAGDPASLDTTVDIGVQQPVITLAPDGSGKFNAVDSNYFILDGNDLIGTFANATYNGYPYNELSTANTDAGEIELTNSYLNRLARGVVYESYWHYDTNTVYTIPNTTPSVVVASGKFKLNKDRSVLFVVSSGGLYANNPTDLPINYTLELGTGPLTLGGVSTWNMRSIVGAGQVNSISLEPQTFDVLSNGSEFAQANIDGVRISKTTAVTGFTATLASTSTSQIVITNANTINGGTRSLWIGQEITKTSGTGTFASYSNVYVTSIINTTAFTIGTYSGIALNHSVAGAIVFSSVATPIVGIRSSNQMSGLEMDWQTYIDRNLVAPVGVTGLGFPYDGYWKPIDVSPPTVSAAYESNVIYYPLLGNAVALSETTDNVTFAVTSATSGNNKINVNSTANIYPGFRVTKANGTGNINTFTRVVSVDRVNNTINVYPSITTTGTMNLTAVTFSTVPSTQIGKATRGLNAQISDGTMPYDTDVYWSLNIWTSAGRVPKPADSSYTLTSHSSPLYKGNGMLQVLDMGQAKGSGQWNPNDELTWDFDGSLPRGKIGSQSIKYDSGSYTVPSTSTGTNTIGSITVSADQSAYYDGYGRGTGTSDPYAYKYSLYQGNPGTASGTKKSAVRFPVLSLPSGATITKAELYLRNRHSYYSSGLTVYIGAHLDANLESSSGTNSQTNANTAPTGIDFTGDTDTFSTHFDKGQGKWVTLPDTWYSSIASGTVRGVLIGLTGVTNTWYNAIANYGYFDGNSMADEPQLRVTYKYEI